MDFQEVAQHRLANQRINSEKFQTAGEVVRWMGAMQAQDYHQALWAVGSRMKSATMSDVEAAIERGEILRTWPMRGTIHFVPPQDAQWMLDLCASRTVRSTNRRREELGLDADMLSQALDVFQQVLGGGARLERGELLQSLERAGISTEGQRGYHMLMYGALHGVICIGPMQGKQQTFALLQDWAGEQRQLTRDESLAELARRFVFSHAPVTEADFARWTGLTLTDSRNGLAFISDELRQEEVDGTTYWLPAHSTTSTLSNRVHFLAGFDEYVLGYKDRGAVVPAEHEQKIVPGKNGIFFPIVVIDGQIVATWKRKHRANSMEITISPFATLGKLQSVVKEAAEAYSRFMEKPISVLTIDE